MEQFSFEKLDAYNQAMTLVAMVYEIAERFPSHEKFGLYNQLHRAIVSVPSNVAESCGRTSCKEKIHFIEIAYGSLLESFCQLQIATNVNYITANDLVAVKPQFFTVSRLLTALSKSYAKLLASPKGEPEPSAKPKPLNP